MSNTADIDPDSAVPALPANYVDRPALHDALDRAAASRLTVLTAGYGWGKTTAAAAWAATRNACWLSLTDSDRAVLHLANRILRVARRQLPGLPAELVVAPTSENRRKPPVNLVVDGLGGQLRRHVQDDLFLVLDGYHEVRADDRAADFVAGLFRQSPPGVHLIVLTRQAVAEEFTPLGNREPINEIGPAQLAFTVAETSAFLNAALGRADPEEAAEIWSLTAGWPAAVRLAAETRRVGKLRGVRARPGTAGRQVLDSLATEVLGNEPEGTRRLLTDTAVLSTIDISLAEALGHHEATTALPMLEQHGLLRADMSGEYSWSVIPPVRDVLLRDLGARSPLVRETHARAAAHRENQHRYAAALYHLIAAQDRQAVERLLVEHGDALIAHGEAAAVASAADLVDVNSADARVLAVLGYALQIQGDWLTALSYLRTAAGTGVLRPALALRLGQLNYLSGRTDLAVETFERVRVGEVAGRDEIRLLCEAAIWLRAAGDDDGARAAAARGAEAAEHEADPAAMALAHRVLAVLAAHDGDRYANDLHHHRALRLAAELGDDLQRVGLLINRASYLAEEGAPVETLETVEAALQLGMASGVFGYEPFCYSIRGRAKARLGRFDEALADIDAAHRRWQEIGPSLDDTFGLFVRGDVHRRRGEPSQAQAVLEEALRSTTDTAVMQPLRAVILSALARARAADDLTAAGELANRSVALATGTGRVPALLARGWIALLAGDRSAAAVDAALARSIAGVRQDRGGLAEALELVVLSGQRPADNRGLLDEAGTLWNDLGDPIGVARARLIQAGLAGPAGRPAADAAAAELAGYGVRVDSGVAGALAVPVDRPPITVQTLGGFRVTRGDKPVPVGEWKSRKARDLFKILVAQRGRPLSREALMDLLWPDEPAKRTANRLSVLLSTLRTVLDPARNMPEPGPVVADRDTIALDPGVVVSDLQTFLAAVATAQTADSRGDPHAPDLLAAAESAYTGDFLPEDLYADWSQPVRDTARTAHIAVLRALTRHAGSAEQREQRLLQLLDQDPYDEQSHRQLIHVLQGAGRHGEAHRRYQGYVKRMAEIGVTPAPYQNPAKDAVARRPAPPARPPQPR